MRQVISFFRLIHTLIVLARHNAVVPKAYTGLLPTGFRVLGWFSRFGRSLPQKTHGERLAKALEQLGPSYVKLGQFLATRGDILSEEMVAGLEGLKDQMQPFSFAQAKEILTDQLGDEWETQILDLSPAKAAASVAQVHQAKDASGNVIAVKLLRPGIAKRIHNDIAAMQMGAQFVEKLFRQSRRLEPAKFVETVARSLNLELDLRMEAAAASELREIAEEVDGVIIPQVNWDLTREHVLVLEWLDGIALTKTKSLAKTKINKAELARTITTSFLEFALDHGVFHADQHEGNLFAMADNQLGLVDFGIVGRIGPPQRRYLAEILYGFLRRDYRRVAEVHFEAGYVPAAHAVDDFAQALRAVGEPVFGKTAENVSMGNLLLQLFTVTSRFDIHLRPELILLQKTMVQVEGVSRNLNPDHDLWGAAAPIIERWITRELGPEGQINELADDLLDLRDAARAIPKLVEDAAQIITDTREHGLSIDDDSLQRMVHYQGRARHWQNLALILGGWSLLALAIKIWFFG